MCRSYSSTLLFVVLSVSAFCQNGSSHEDGQAARASGPLVREISRSAEEDGGIALLKKAEAEAAGLDVGMRAWTLWQIGMAYQSSGRAKALDLFEIALSAARLIPKDASGNGMASFQMAPLTGRPPLTPRLQLQADIARSIVLLEPNHGDQVVEQVDPAARGSVLTSLLAYQEKEKHFDEAVETLERITAQDEMPYDRAMRLMDDLKPEQSTELMQLFLAALASYRDHAPHLQFKDDFPVMLSRYWKRLPKKVVQQAIDEVVQQAASTDEKGSYSVIAERGASTLGSIGELRLSQIMPVLREIDPSAAKQYLEKYPALASSIAPFDVPHPAGSGGASFRPSFGYNSGVVSAMEVPMAQKAAAQADSGRAEDAMAQAAGIRDANLRAQAYEYIARVTASGQASTAAKAIESMLDAAKKSGPKEEFPYYSSAADIYMRMDEEDDAKQSIEAGIAVADKLYQSDSDDDDPNTALKAFWPSTNAYCTLFRQAARISPAWAISMLRNIEDPEVRVAAETALAGGWLKTPIGPNTMMVAKKSGSSFSFGARE